MSMTVSVRVKHNGQSKAAGQRRHDARVGKQPAYVDRTRSGLNSVIQPTMTESYAREQCETLRAQNPHEREMKSNAAILTAGIITFGTEAQPVIESLNTEQQDALYSDIAERIANELETRLVGLAVHRDESAPHAHFSLLAVNKNGIPLSQVITKPIASRMQDIAGEVLAEHGHPEIKRGKPKIQRIQDGDDWSKIIHKSVKQLHEDLPRELEALHKEIADAEAKLLKNKRLIEKAENDLKDANADTEKVLKRMITYEKRESDALARIEIAKVEAERKEKLINKNNSYQKHLPAGFHF